MEEPGEIRRWTRVEYDRLIECGFFDARDRVELLGGHLIVSEPQSPGHYGTIQALEQAVRAAFGPGWHVRTQGPVALDDESEPEPDLAVVPGTFRDYREGHPTSPVLVVEVSVSSLRLDRGRKADLYARAGLADYWIVNLVDRVLEIHREPAPDPHALFGWRYASVTSLGLDASISPLASPNAVVRVADLML